MPRSTFQKHIDSSFRPLWVVKTLGIIIASCYALLLIGNYLLTNSQDVSYKKWQKTHPLPSIFPSITPVISSTPVPQISPLSFSSELPKARTAFDLTTWKEFSDSRIGLKFKYPSDWGVPDTVFTSPEKTDACKATGHLYTLTFPHSSFRVGGESLDYSTECGRGRGINDLYYFSGFTSCSQSRYQQTNLLFCQVLGNKLHLLSSYNYWSEDTYVGNYYRLLFINQKTNRYSGGIALGGPFFSSELNQKISLMCKQDDEVCQEKYYSLIDKATLDRKLDKQSMATFDTFEKVFETVELIK